MNEKPMQYNHKEIEKKWQGVWDEKGVYKTADQKAGAENEYILVEFPYPSGDLHVGHWYAFAITDIYAKYRRMLGKNVLFPVGFDAFGLPAENAAIKNNLNPREWTFSNIEFMKTQMKRMGASFDWEHLVVTCSPEYYKWTQWLFLKFLENNLAYQSETNVNWCPSCKTVLANEQVTGGKCERCGTEVIQKKMKQWQLGITKYADRLIDDLDTLDWPHAIKEAQKNWIGRSEGSLIPFKVVFEKADTSDTEISFEVFTTRADTLFGVSYVVLAPESDLVQSLLEKVSNRAEVEAYISQTSKKTEMDRIADNKEKTGVQLQGVFVINPTNNEQVPVFISDYVLAGYGTGAVMAVPAHDERDFTFAKKFNLPIKEVVIPSMVDTRNPPVTGKEYVIRKNVHPIVRNNKGEYLCLKWKKHDWTTFPMGGVEDGEDIVEAAKREVYEETGYKNLKFIEILGGPVRAEYFAAHKDQNRVAITQAVVFELIDEENDPIKQEEADSHEVFWMPIKEATTERMTHTEMIIWIERLSGSEKIFTDEGSLINSKQFDNLTSSEAAQKITEFVGGKMTKNYRLRDWLVSRQRYWGCPIPVIHCAKCGVVAVPEADLPVVLPEISDFMPREDGKSPLAKATEWLNVKCPKCGGDAERETDTLDTFIDSSWYYLRYVDPKNDAEFASKEKQDKWLPVNFYSGGSEHTTMHLLFARFFHKALFDFGLVKSNEPFTTRLNRGLILGPDGNKMSKSKGNVINPDEIVERLGADTVRGYLSFIGPYNEPGNYPWDLNGVVGIRRFIEKMCRVKVASETSLEVKKELSKTIKKVSEDYQKLKFNTALAQLMIFTNLAEKNSISKEDYQTYLKLVFPIFPHVAEELWSESGGEGLIVESSWPEQIEIDLSNEQKIINISINGKFRGTVEVSPEADEAEVQKIAFDNPNIAKWLDGKTIKKTIYVKGKLLSFVIEA
jgi:leucyl-tRNA synthetase